MAQSVTPLRLLDPPGIDAALVRIRDRLLRHVTADGHTPLLFPDMCAYRFSQPTTFGKAAFFGVTFGVVLQGEQRVKVQKHEFTVEPSRFFVMTRESEFEGAALRATPERPHLGLALCFRPEQVARALILLSEAGGSAAPESVPVFLLERDHALTSALERLVDALDDPLDRQLLAPLAIDEILFRLLRSDAAAAMRAGVGQAGDAERMLAAMRFIRMHHADKLSVERLAKQVAMSPSHFAHRFRAVARVSPMRYLREVRLERARALLREPGARVSDVALEVGFESPAHFTREFRRRFGTPPSRSLAVALLTPELAPATA